MDFFFLITSDFVRLTPLSHFGESFSFIPYIFVEGFSFKNPYKFFLTTMNFNHGWTRICKLPYGRKNSCLFVFICGYLKKEVVEKSVYGLERLFFLIVVFRLYYSEFLKAAGVMPVRRLKYLLKKEGLGKPISSEI